MIRNEAFLLCIKTLLLVSKDTVPGKTNENLVHGSSIARGWSACWGRSYSKAAWGWNVLIHQLSHKWGLFSCHTHRYLTLKHTHTPNTHKLPFSSTAKSCALIPEMSEPDGWKNTYSLFNSRNQIFLMMFPSQGLEAN